MIADRRLLNNLKNSFELVSIKYTMLKMQSGNALKDDSAYSCPKLYFFNFSTEVKTTNMFL